MDDSALSISGRLLAVLALLLANAFFVAAEFALVTVRRTRVEQRASEGRATAQLLRRALGRLDTYIAACQLGITMASIGLGWIGEPALASLLEPAFGFLPERWTAVTSHGVALGIAFTAITGFHVVLGELSPKGVALQYAEKTAFAIIWPLHWFLLLFRPAIWLLNQAGWLVLRPLGIRRRLTEHLVHSPEELRMLFEASEEAGVLGEHEELMLSRVLEFSGLAAHQVMVPRTEVVAISADADLRQALATVAAHGHTRYPVVRGGLDNVMGLLHSKDLLRVIHEGAEDGFRVEKVMRPILRLPESLPIHIFFNEMRRRGTQMAVAIDEFGGTAGLVTMEDILERIVGQLRDEFDRLEEPVRRLPDGGAVVDGLVLVQDVNESFGLHLEEEPYDTIGGYVFGRLGRRARVGDEVTVDGWNLRVLALDGLRVARVRLAPLPRIAPAGEPGPLPSRSRPR